MTKPRSHNLLHFICIHLWTVVQFFLNQNRYIFFDLLIPGESFCNIYHYLCLLWSSGSLNNNPNRPLTIDKTPADFTKGLACACLLWCPVLYNYRVYIFNCWLFIVMPASQTVQQPREGQS